MRTHGTHSGYQSHLRRGETPCDACREAHRVYQTAYRTANPVSREWSNAGDRARKRAQVRLVKEHPEDFQRLYAEELAKENRYREPDEVERTALGQALGRQP